MKKFGFALVALLALSLTFISCADDSFEVLEASDITADWCNGTWSGSATTTTVADGTEIIVTNTITSDTLTVSELKAYLTAGNNNLVVFGTGGKTETVIKANKKRTKLNIESVATTLLGGEEISKITTITNLEKD